MSDIKLLTEEETKRAKEIFIFQAASILKAHESPLAKLNPDTYKEEQEKLDKLAQLLDEEDWTKVRIKQKELQENLKRMNQHPLAQQIIKEGVMEQLTGRTIERTTGASYIPMDDSDTDSNRILMIILIIAMLLLLLYCFIDFFFLS